MIVSNTILTNYVNAALLTQGQIETRLDDSTYTTSVLRKTTFLALIQLVFNACLATVKCRSVLHHCLVIFSDHLGSWNMLLFMFTNRVSIMS